MKKTLLTITAGALVIAACGQPENSNEAASDTASILDTTRMNSPLDTAAVNDVRGTDSAGRLHEGEHQESTGKQASRVNVGTDTTGKQEHDNKPK